MSFFSRRQDIVPIWIRTNLRYFWSSYQPQLWFLAVCVGLAVALAAIFFRIGIAAVQYTWLGTFSQRVVSAASDTPWWLILLAPAVGGLIVGLILQFLHPEKRVGSVADVISARAHGGRGLGFLSGLLSALVTMISIGSGASAGREGPVVHLGGTLATALCRHLSLPDNPQRILLGCGVASAISASFNAPFAGILFAHEVILGYYAVRAFVPIVISSVVGTTLARIQIGDIAAFAIPEYQITSYWEIPAFALLGLTCAAVAIIFQFAMMGTSYVDRSIVMPLWLRPVIGGLLVGGIAIIFPQVLGIGYETTDEALKTNLPLMLMLMLLIAKTAATAITLATRFGGGIVGPCLYIGAMTGGAFGLIAASIFPDLASSHGLYALLGMGAVAAAVLGAPISTTMIVFELTGGYSLALALLITVSIATGLTYAVFGRSFFLWQLESRGIFLQDGPHQFLSRHIQVHHFMNLIRPNEGLHSHELAKWQYRLRRDETLDSALQVFDLSGQAKLPVVETTLDGQKIHIAWATHIAALRHFNSALISTSVEEHR